MSIDILTFNIRYDGGERGAQSWPRRVDGVRATLRAHRPDLVGIQEATAGQWQDLLGRRTSWSPVGATLDDEGTEQPLLLARTSRFRAAETGRFWLSGTPEVANRTTWRHDWGPRSCVWVRLVDRRRRRSLVFACTHLDPRPSAWLPSARVLRREIDRLAGDVPVILVGDFNTAAGSAAHRYLCGPAGFRDAWTESGHADKRVISFNGFTRASRLPTSPGARRAWLRATAGPPPPGSPRRAADYARHVMAHGNYRIDWILIRGPLVCERATIDVRRRGAVRASDHFPVAARVNWVG